MQHVSLVSWSRPPWPYKIVNELNKSPVPLPETLAEHVKPVPHVVLKELMDRFRRSIQVMFVSVLDIFGCTCKG